MPYKHVKWLLDCEPRIVQLEATSRAHYGIEVMNHRFDEPNPIRMTDYKDEPFKGFAYFMQMRTGKTPTVLNQFMLLRKDFNINSHIVFAPAKYKADWKPEAERFGIDVEAGVYESSKAEWWQDWAKERKDVGYQLSINYEALIYPDKVEGLLELVGPDVMLSADESVALKNPKSTFFKGFHSLAKEAGYVRIATGKPVVQGSHDLFAQLRVVRQLEGVNFFSFRNRFCQMGGFKGKKVVGVKNADHLGEILRRSTFVAKRPDWMDTHETDYQTVKVDMLPKMKAAYKEFDEEFIIEINDTMITADQAITKHMKLQQLSSGFMYDEDKKAQIFVPTKKLPKFIDMRQKLDDEIEGKSIVIAVFNQTLDSLLDALGADRCAIIRGGMKDAEVLEEKRRFNEDPRCRVIIGQIKAIKYGHTLMGTPDDPCLDIFYYENSYSLDDRAQTEERPQGEGQVGPIHITDYSTCKIETDIAKALQRKESISKVIFSHYER